MDAVAPTPWPRLAPHWEALFPLRPTRLAMALALLPSGGAVLDAGCATGALSRALAARGHRAQGLDLEPAFLAEGRRRAAAEGVAVRWHRASLLDLARTTAPGSLDLVTCLGQTLPHLLEEEAWRAFFAQAREVLRPGGRLVVQAVHDGSLPVGHARDLPVLECPAGRLERWRVMLPEDLAAMDTRFTPPEGEPVSCRTLHRRMGPARAAELMAAEGLRPGPPLADEAGSPWREDAPAWILAAERP